MVAEKNPNTKCLLNVHLEPFRSKVKRRHSEGKEFQNPAVQGTKI